MDLDSRIFRFVGWIGVALLAIATLVVAVQGDWSGVALLATFLVASILFLACEGRLPTLFDALFVTAAIVNAAGWVWHLYKPVWGYDEFAHFYTTFAVTLSVGYLTLYVVREHFRKHRMHFMVVITSFGVTLGAWWEVVEWMILGKLTDPAGDILVDSFGAILAGCTAAWALGLEPSGPPKGGREPPAGERSPERPQAPRPASGTS